MKTPISILTTILLVMTGCGGNKQADDGLITVDVTASYPKKELILQDFMDVEYIPLESTDEFVCQGFVQAIGKKFIIVRNYANDGDIFIFNRDGKGIRKINRRGQGNEEYTSIVGIVLDEDNDEMYVNCLTSRSILVYDLLGNFKRRLKHKEGFFYTKIGDFDRDNLICHENYFPIDKEVADKNYFFIVSKRDGSIKEIQIPYEKKIITTTISADRAWSTTPSTFYPIIPYFGKWVLVESASDTVYSYSPDHTMTPLIVRTPDIQSMNPEVFLFPSVLTDRYYFMEAVKKEVDFSKNDGFPSTSLIYDRQERAIFRYDLHNGDFSNKTPVKWGYDITIINNAEIAFLQKLDIYSLIESNEKGELRGRLKEIAANLDEESNPVIMIAKHKK